MNLKRIEAEVRAAEQGVRDLQARLDSHRQNMASEISKAIEVWADKYIDDVAGGNPQFIANLSVDGKHAIKVKIEQWRAMLPGFVTQTLEMKAPHRRDDWRGTEQLLADEERWFDDGVLHAFVDAIGQLSTLLGKAGMVTTSHKAGQWTHSDDGKGGIRPYSQGQWPNIDTDKLIAVSAFRNDLKKYFQAQHKLEQDRQEFVRQEAVGRWRAS